MTKIENVVNLLGKGEELTSKEITEKIGDITSDVVCVYLNKLLKNGTIERTTDKKPYKYKKALTPIELLKQLYDLMDSKMDFVKKAVDEDIELIKQIELVIK